MLGKNENIKKYRFSFPVIAIFLLRSMCQEIRKNMNALRQYVPAGGIQPSVLAYLDDKNFAALDKMRHRSLRLYRNDVFKFFSLLSNLRVSATA